MPADIYNCTTLWDTDPQTEPYVAPPTVCCLNPSNAYCIEAPRLTVTVFGVQGVIPASGLQVIAEAVRVNSGVDGILGTVRIQGPYSERVDPTRCDSPYTNFYRMQVLYPKAYKTYTSNCDVIPVYLTTLPTKLDSVAKHLTNIFKSTSAVYAETLAATNAHLPASTQITAFAFPDGFAYVGDYLYVHPAATKCGKPIPTSKYKRWNCCTYVDDCEVAPNTTRARA